MSVQNATSLVGNADREGSDRWIRRGNSFGTISAATRCIIGLGIAIHQIRYRNKA